jgi:hypothetical protein
MQNKQGVLALFPMLWKSEMDSVRKYQDQTESMLSSELNKRSEIYNEYVGADPEFLESLADELIEIRDDSTYFIRTMILLKAFFTIEHWLEYVCRRTEAVSEIDYMANRKDKGIKKSIKYLKKEFNIKIQANDWDKLFTINKVVNIIKHSNGSFSRSNKKTVKIINQLEKTFSNCKISDVGVFEPEEGFITEAIDLKCSILQFIEDKFREQHPQVLNFVWC